MAQPPAGVLHHAVGQGKASLGQGTGSPRRRQQKYEEWLSSANRTFWVDPSKQAEVTTASAGSVLLEVHLSMAADDLIIRSGGPSWCGSTSRTATCPSRPRSSRTTSGLLRRTRMLRAPRRKDAIENAGEVAGARGSGGRPGSMGRGRGGTHGHQHRLDHGSSARIQRYAPPDSVVRYQVWYPRNHGDLHVRPTKVKKRVSQKGSKRFQKKGKMLRCPSLKPLLKARQELTGERPGRGVVGMSGNLGGAGGYTSPS